VEQVIRTAQFANPLDLDTIVVRSLKDFSGPLSGLDRLLDRAYSPDDIKGRAGSVARLTAIVAYTTLSQDYDREMTKLEQQVTHLFESDNKVVTSEKQLLVSVIERMKTKYRRLSSEINILYETIPYSEIAEKSGQEINAILLSDSIKKLLILRRYLGITAEQDTEASIRQAIETLSAIVKYAAAMIKTEVTLYTEKGVLSGFVHHLEGERLSDLLNEMSDSQNKLDSLSLEFGGNTIQTQEGLDQTPPTTTVKKTSIHLLTLSDFNAGRGAGAKDGPKAHPFVAKTRVPVEIKTAEYSLLGYLYCKPGQTPEELLKETSDFLSLTDVSIYLPKERFSYSIPYAAVNKGRILAIAQEPAFSRHSEPVNVIM
jgi:hypothetical protein